MFLFSSSRMVRAALTSREDVRLSRVADAFVSRVNLFARFPRGNIVWADLRWAFGAVCVELMFGAERVRRRAFDFSVFSHFPETERSDSDEISSLEEISVGDRVDSSVSLSPERVSLMTLRNNPAFSYSNKASAERKNEIKMVHFPQDLTVCASGLADADFRNAFLY